MAQAHYQVKLAPLPPRVEPSPVVAEYDLYESDYATAQRPPSTQQPTGTPVLAPASASASGTYADADSVKVQVPLDFDLSSLSLGNHEDSPPSDLAALPLRFAEGESKNPVERSGYVDGSRFSGSDQGHPPADSPRNSSFGPGVVHPPGDIHAQSPKRTASVDSTSSAVRAYVSSPSSQAFANSPVVAAASPVAHHYPAQQGYGAHDYGYSPEYHRPPPQHQPLQRPPVRAPPQHYSQYPPHDPRYQQQQQPPHAGAYGANGYPSGYDPYGQPYGSEYGHDYYHDPHQQHPQPYPGAGYGGPGYRPPGPGYGPPQQFHGRPPGANLQPNPSMRGPPPGRGGPRPMMMGPGGPPGGPYGPRPPFRGESGSSLGPGRPIHPAGPGASAAGAGAGAAVAAGAGPRRRPLTIEVLDDMRQRARNSNDPAAQLEYAKALIEAAVTFGNDDPDPKRQKKNKEALFLEGLKIIKRLATSGVGIGKPAYADAQFFLANCYGNGSLGLQIDHDKAFNLYVQAAKQNHPAATYRTAVCHELGAGTKRDHSRAVQYFRKAASLGDTAGMYKLGMVLLKGLLGQQSNPREAITWLKRAAANADEDNPHALHELGLCFEKAGIPTVIPDEAYSRELFTQAAGYGYAPSQFKLGHCYEYGTLTCPVDPRRSIAWYTRAAEQGDAESELGLSGWYLTGAEGVLKQSDTEAYLWARKAADKGLSRAEYAVGYYSEVGIGVKQDLEEARRWYLRSAAQGNNRAKKRLTDMKKLGAMRRVRHDRGRQAGHGPDDENCKVM
ncbi:hypothetical protein EC968_002399 [Mortierella alpina]|nr:hypothetical protein EC968_002399 [Mortierella alpina]